MNFAYHRNPRGGIVEIVPTSIRESYYAWLNGTGEDYA
jgi:hypothetical protein